MEQERYTGCMRDLLILLFKHKYTIVITFLSIVIIVTIVSFLLPPVYQAKSSFMVKFGREYIYNPEVGDTRPTISFQSFGQKEAIISEMQILRSNDLIEKVITTIGINNIYPDIVQFPPKRIKPLEAAILDFEKNISVKDIKQSNVIAVSFRHKDPEVAARIVNQLIEFYKEKHLQVLSNPKSSFIEKQLSTYKQKLEESENNFEAFKQKYKIVSLDQQRSLLLQQRMDLDTSLKTIQNRLNELGQVRSSPEILLTSQDARYFSQSERYKVIDDAKAELLSVELREKQLLGKYEESSRLIVNIRKEIRLVQEFIQEQEKNLVDTELASLESQRFTIKSQLNQLDKEMRVLDLREKELLNLKREVATNESNYKVYLSKFEEARISDDMDRQKMSNIGVIQEAIVPAKPIKPNKGFNIVLGIILGAVSSLGFAFFSEYTSQVLSTPESVERHLDLPVLITISHSHNKEKTKSHFVRWGIGTIATLLFIGGVFWTSSYGNKDLSSVENPDSPQAVHTKPVISEIKKKVSTLEENLFSDENEQCLSTVQEAVVGEMINLSVLKTSETTFQDMNDPSVSIAQEATIQEESELIVPTVLKAPLQRRIRIPRWAINIYSTTLRDKAISLLDKIRENGYNVYMTEFKHKNDLWYRVRIGFFPTKKDAQLIGQGITKKFSVNNFWIVKAPDSEILKYKKK